MFVSVHDWTVLRVNQEVVRVVPGATIPLCQAIPVIALTAHLRASHLTPATRRVRVRIRVPGHAPRHRSVRLRQRTRVTFTPRGLKLRDEAFPEGTYRLSVRRAGRTLTRATLIQRGGGTC